MDRPFIKVFREEREQTIFFLVDVSRSLEFGRKRSKRDIVTEIAALLAYAAIKSNDKIGLVIFSDHIEAYIPPKKGRAHVWKLIATILSHQPKGGKTDIAQAIRFFLNVTHRRTTCFLLSDFFDQSYESALKVAQIRHEFVVIRLLDELERKLPPSAIVEFEDLESAARYSADLGTARVRRQFEEIQDKSQVALARFLRAHEVDFLDLQASEDFVEALQRYFLTREHKR